MQSILGGTHNNNHVRRWGKIMKVGDRLKKGKGRASIKKGKTSSEMENKVGKKSDTTNPSVTGGTTSCCKRKGKT